MTPFAKHDDSFVATIEPIEAALVSQLAGQIRALVNSSADATPDAPRDAALLRLLPDAYRGDREASAEFRRFTAAGLVEKKVRNADVVIDDLADAAASAVPSELRLGASSVQAWLRSLTDVRLVLATRLGIEDAPESTGDASITPEQQMLGDVYDWLGWVQGSLVEALDAPGDRAGAE